MERKYVVKAPNGEFVVSQQEARKVLMSVQENTFTWLDDKNNTCVVTSVKPYNMEVK